MMTLDRTEYTIHASHTATLDVVDALDWYDALMSWIDAHGVPAHDIATGSIAQTPLHVVVDLYEAGTYGRGAHVARIQIVKTNHLSDG